MRVLIVPSGLNACSHYRLIQPALVAQRQGGGGLDIRKRNLTL